jgi:hypothetical protein
MTICGIALILLFDVSASIGPRELEQINEAHAQAFENSLIHNSIERSGGISVRILHFSENVSSRTPWRIIISEEDSRRFASEIRMISREEAGPTATGNAIDKSLDILETAPCGETRVIDIVTDGPENYGMSVIDARERATNSGVRINALSIETLYGDPSSWVLENVVTSDGFSLTTTYNNIIRMLRRKLLMEISLN